MLKEAVLLGYWFGGFENKNAHVRAVAKDLKDKAIEEIGNVITDIGQGLARFPVLFKNATIVRAVGEYMMDIGGARLNHLDDIRRIIKNNVMQITKELGKVKK